MDILIITVGTRQIGWKCKDSIIRCFGADGDRLHPPHIDELYSELNLERGSHEPGINWGVRHLGETYYQHCQTELGGDFSAVQLLMDGKIIRDLVADGLKTVILWATNQPETVPWKYRSADTLWLARLMESKIQVDFPDLQVDVIDTELNIMERKKVYEELQEIVLPLALEQTNSPQPHQNLQVAIQTKGCAPAIANIVDIFSGTLVRQFEVFKVTPEEPKDNYPEGDRRAKFSERIDVITVSEYFWHLEKDRIQRSWKQGNFAEAQTLLTAHQSKLLTLYELAGHLNLARNREVARIFTKKYLGQWLADETTVRMTGTIKRDMWEKKRQAISNDDYQKLWESTFLLNIELNLGYFTAAFFLFAQLIEQLLFKRADEEKWIDKGLIKVRSDWDWSRGTYNPKSTELVDALTKVLPSNNTSQERINALHNIRILRNNVTHKNIPVDNLQTFAQAISLNNPAAATKPQVFNRCLEILCWTLKNPEEVNQQTLLESVFLWGIETLQSTN
ncbi:hypothetical protein [[Limnothrix rosea] IAM M-220]|uniref:hypothetical protein n=1 Tax=[Limnothrix rosea] IAM M-220 TaxID=454133 RepID=UPI000961DD7D|nr:hypothetical protein [[Limnothrix rosea] IAM M-220]OKH15954.1 hypothetical protein NIES208_12285 [[Limnothrix rosea] IAM M-220]